MIGFGLPRSSLPREPLEVTLRELPYRDPFGAFLSLRRTFPHCFLLESGSGPERLAEHTFIGFAPQRVISLRDGRFTVDGVDVGPATDPLEFLRDALPRAAGSGGEGSVYLGGLVGFISYDFVSYLERLPERFDPVFPAFVMGLYLDGVAFHHREGRCIYFSLGPDRFGEVVEALKQGCSPGEFSLKDLRPHTSREEFLGAVRVAKEYIRAGDIYQVVLSRRLSGRFCGDLAAAYARLRELNPSPYMYFLDFGDVQIAGSSPEMFLAARGRRLFTCPIAGTRPITGDPAVDETYRKELLSDEKELAEHNMLVDLARNDIGRVSRFGTVGVSEYMVVERFSHVQHIVSRVEGALADGLDAFDAMAALFPAGTVSGAPKVRAMEIIAELEPEPRGPYAGIVGYFSANGNMDSAITIRTIFARGNRLYLQAGAGIVADSVPEREWEETQGKLGALLAALEIGGAR